VVLASQFRITSMSGRGIRRRQLSLDFRDAGERVLEATANTQLVFPYFWRKRSTRPAVSTSFCFPV
jgi:hypothetical protein